MVENYYSYFSFLSGVNSNASSQALPNSPPVTTPIIRLDCTGTFARESWEITIFFFRFFVLIFTWSYRSALLVTAAIECIIKPLEVLACYSLWITELNLNKRGVLTTDSYYNNSNCQSNTTHKNKLFGSIFVSFRARVTTRLEGSWATKLDISDSSSKAYPSSSHNLCNRARIKSSSIW